MTSTMEVTVTRNIDELRQGIPSAPAELECLPSLPANKAVVYQGGARQLTNQLSLIRLAKTRKSHAVKETKQTRSESVTGRDDVQSSKATGLLPVAIRPTKRERLLSLNFTSTLNLLGDNTVTFDDVHWTTLTKFMDAWERYNSVWFRNLPMRNLSTTLVAISGKGSSESEAKTPYICIRGLSDEKEIAAFHAVLSQENAQFYYRPLRICFDRSSIRTASTDQLYVMSGLSGWTMCGTMAEIVDADGTHYSTVGGLLEINGIPFLITVNHEVASRSSDESQRVSYFLSRVDTSESENGPLVVDSWAANSIFEAQPEALVPSSDDVNREVAMASTWDRSNDLTGQHWRAYTSRAHQTVPNAFLLPGDSETLFSSPIDAYTSPSLRFVSGLGASMQGNGDQRREVVILAARSGTSLGTVSQNISFIALQSSKWTRVFTVRVKEGYQLEKGDSGAWVIDETDNSLLGHVIAVSGLFGYVLPISQVLEDFKTRLGGKVNVKMPPPFQHLAELAKHTYELSTGFDTEPVILSIALRAISKDVLNIGSASVYADVLACTLQSENDALIFARVLCIVGADSQAMLDFQNWVIAMQILPFAKNVRISSRAEDGKILFRRFQSAVSQQTAPVRSLLAHQKLETPTDLVSDIGIADRNVGLQHDCAGTDEEENREKVKDHQKSATPAQVGWSSEDDPQNPKNWTHRFKYFQLWLLIAAAFLSNFGFMVMVGPAFEIMRKLDVRNAQLVTFAITAYTLGQLLGHILVTPIHHVHGHRLVLLVFFTMFPVANICCALSKNAAMFIIFRIVAGCVSILPCSHGSEIICEMFKPADRPRPALLYSMTGTLGASIGLVLGSILIANLEWQWIFWINAIASAIPSVAGAFFLRETHTPVILERKANRLRRDTSNWNASTALARKSLASVYCRVWDTHCGAMRTQFPVLNFIYVSEGVLQASIYIIYATLSYVFGRQYSFSGIKISLTVTGIAISSLVAVGTIVTYRNRWPIRPKAERLGYLINTTICGVSGFMIYGWTAEYRIHEVVPILATALFPIGRATSVISPHSVVGTTTRLLFGACLPLCGIPLYEKLGIGWGNTTLGLIYLVMSLVSASICYHYKLYRYSGLNDHALGGETLVMS